MLHDTSAARRARVEDEENAARCARERRGRRRSRARSGHRIFAGWEDRSAASEGERRRGTLATMQMNSCDMTRLLRRELAPRTTKTPLATAVSSGGISYPWRTRAYFWQPLEHATLEYGFYPRRTRASRPTRGRPHYQRNNNNIRQPLEHAMLQYGFTTSGYAAHAFHC